MPTEEMAFICIVFLKLAFLVSFETCKNHQPKYTIEGMKQACKTKNDDILFVSLKYKK